MEVWVSKHSWLKAYTNITHHFIIFFFVKFFMKSQFSHVYSHISDLLVHKSQQYSHPHEGQHSVIKVTLTFKSNFKRQMMDLFAFSLCFICIFTKHSWFSIQFLFLISKLFSMTSCKLRLLILWLDRVELDRQHKTEFYFKKLPQINKTKTQRPLKHQK